MRNRRRETDQDTDRHGGEPTDGHHRLLLHHADVDADGTHLCLLDGRTLHFAALPDRAGAPRVRAALRRISHVEIVVDHGRAAARVQGLGHRRLHVVPVSLGTALALAVEGSPTVVDLVDDAQAASEAVTA